MPRRLPDPFGDATEPKQISALSKQKIRSLAAMEKMLPHELLLYWANGISVAGFTPNQAQQLAAAMAAAPYYAPKLANIEMKQDVRVKAVIAARSMTAEEWSKEYLPQQNDQGEGGSLVKQNPKTISVTDAEILPTTSLPTEQNDRACIGGNSQLQNCHLDTAGSKNISNRKPLESHDHIHPSTADANFDCSTPHNKVIDDDTL